jgi:hypothetical protein
MTAAVATAPAYAPTERSAGVLRRLFDRVVAARRMQVRRTVNTYLAGLDDATLAELGLNRAELRRSAVFPVSMI